MSIKKKLMVSVVAMMMIVTTLVSLTSCRWNKEKIKTGFDYELANAVAAKYDIAARSKLIEWSNKEIELKNGEIDAIWNGFSINDERKKQITFSAPYLENKQVFLMNKENEGKYKTVQDLKSLGSKKVCAEAGSTGDSVLSDNGVEFTKSTSQLDALLQLDSNQVDVIIIDRVMAGYYLSNNNRYKGKFVQKESLEGLVNTKESFGIGFKKGNEYTAYMINKALYELQKEGKILEIAKKYGLEDSLVEIPEPKQPTDKSSKQGWDKIIKNGKFVYGCTIYMPMAGTGKEK